MWVSHFNCNLPDYLLLNDVCSVLRYRPANQWQITCHFLSCIIRHVGILDMLLDSEKDRNKLLKEYKFAPNDSLVFVERNRGGSGLQPLKGHVWLTKEPCCVTCEDNLSEWRAKLACGHVVGRLV